MAYYKTCHPDIYPILKEYARENRAHQTEAEKRLWKELKEGKLGHKFLRQHIIGDYIVDFLCPEDGLIVEVDGGYHAERQQQEDDEIRTQWLQSQGFRVIRFTNDEVMFEIDSVLRDIEKQLK